MNISDPEISVNMSKFDHALEHWVFRKEIEALKKQIQTNTLVQILGFMGVIATILTLRFH